MKTGRSRLLLGAAGLVLLLVAGTVYRGCASVPDCGIADSVAVIDQATVAGQPLSLVHRITGFSDKVEFVEVYAGTPAFDSCGRSTMQPLSSDSYDPAQGFVRSLALRDGKVELLYTREATEAVAMAKLRMPRE
jgi:hypothetical protein